MATSESVMASTGVASTKIRLVAYIDHRKSGIRNHVMPGARMRWIVTMKLRPVRIEEKPVTKMPSAVGMTCVVEDTVLNGVSKVQPVSTPPVTSAYSVK